ncbi:MAG: transporter substrate-binding domain-containing protein [Deltaproteobacteria bacterium]|nr:transporter substrate-binding domain-containing protein [Deltaproteobacteria bacterium]
MDRSTSPPRPPSFARPRRCSIRDRVFAFVAALCLLGVLNADAQERPLRVGINRAWPPHQFLDENGRATGFDVELFRAVAEVTKLRYELVVDDWKGLRTKLEAGEIDVIPGVFETPPREPVMDFSVPTVWVHHTVFVRMDSPVRSIEDLDQGSRVLIRESGPHDDVAEHLPEGLDRIRVRRSSDLLRRLADGEGEAAISLDTLGLWAIRDGRIPDVRSIGRPLDTMRLRFAVPEGRDELLGTLNDGLAELRENGRYDRLYDAWFGVLQPKGLPTDQVLAVVAGIAALLVAAIAWSVTLRIEVARRTAKLLAAEQQQRELERRLLEGEKMEALGRMATGVAHDFNNLLTVIGGNVELARADLDRPERAREALAEIDTATHSAAAMVVQLLAFGRGDRSAIRRTAWSTIVTTTDPLLRRLLPEAISLRHDLDPEAGEIEIDPAQAQQIVMNLVLNARDALVERGTITIRTRAVARDDRCWSELAVLDDGPGIDETTLARIFEPFYSTRGSGRGIGLATVKAIAERHGGCVEVESRRGEGACFHVRLARSADA